MAEAAGIEGASSESMDGLARHLAHRPVLLVLDNCEHVLEGAAALVDLLLERGDGAQVLATSREPLGVAGEHLWPLGPLGADGPRLFVERARAAEPRLDWDADHPAVQELCRRLDGVPLALELAAGQLRRFDLEELNRRLGDRLSLLGGRAGGEGERHATMEAAIDWSYRLLDGAEQRLLRHLGTFPSSFDLEAVEASARDLPGDPLAVLGQLVDKSLVVREPGTGRYRLLETIRMFARDRLDEARETEAAFERHRRYVGERLGSGSRLDRWMSARRAATFRAGLDDARQAFRLGLRQPDPSGAVDVAVGASFLWRNAIGCVEGDRWVDQLATLDLAPGDEAWAHLLRADVSQGRGHHERMFAAAASATGLLRRVDDPAAACLAAHFAALAHLTDVERAHDHLGVALDLAHHAGDPRLAALVEAFGAVADLAAGRLPRVRAEVAMIDGWASEDGYDRFILHWTGWMGGLAERDAAVARGWMNRQHEFLHRTGVVETWLSTLSTAMCDVIDGGDVLATLGRSLALADREGYRADADCLLVLAYAELGAGRLEAAAELLGTATHGRFNATAHYVLYLAVLEAPLRQALGPAATQEAMARGRARTPAEVLAAAGLGRDRALPGQNGQVPGSAPSWRTPPPVGTSR